MKSSTQIQSIFLSLAVSAGLFACDDGDDPATGDGGSLIDAGPPADAAIPKPYEFFPVSGNVVEYFAATEDVIVANATVNTEGLRPQIDATATAAGEYTMDILADSLFFLTADATGFVPSRSTPIQMLKTPIVRTIFVASEAGVASQYSGAGVTAVAGDGIVMVVLTQPDGLAAVGVPVADVTLTAIAQPGTPIGTSYMVDVGTGNLSPTGTTPMSVADKNGVAKAGFLNVPAGEYNVNVVLPDSLGTQTIFIIVPAGGASFVLSSLNGEGRGAPTRVLDPTVKLGFTEDIYPILQISAVGGDGCAVCHDASHPLNYTAGPEATLALLQLDAMDPVEPRLNMDSPEDSPFVLNPVYEDVPNHPNVFWTVNANHYKGIVAWIAQGAALLREDAVIPN
ncbi:MAG: hypothetical protein JKY56_06245 [Kofleriaceae bacterium]|nr:hypothetical protein [Kofleriaceae bacterium]